MKSLLSVFFCTSCVFAQNVSVNSHPEVKLGGEADFFVELAHMPSSVQGQSRFDFALLQVSPEVKVDEDIALAFRFVLTEERSSSEKNYLNQLQNGFIRYHDHLYRALTHELGLFRSAWITESRQSGELDFFGDSGRSLTRRYGFVAEGELGYQARYQQNDQWLWVLNFSNGEENKSEEKGPNKEVFLGSFYKTANMTWQLGVSAGRVDRIDSEINEKNRVYLRFEKSLGRFDVGLEGLYAQDPSLDLENNNRLEGITFVELADPKEIKTYGGRLDISYALSEKQKLFLRVDQVTPKSEKKRIQSLEAAWTKQESERMKWGLFYERTDLGAQHSPQSKVRELGRLGLEVKF